MCPFCFLSLLVVSRHLVNKAVLAQVLPTSLTSACHAKCQLGGLGCYFLTMSPPSDLCVLFPLLFALLPQVPGLQVCLDVVFI